ncbi:MAG: alpha/beta hydrolase [Jatrophihabitantaceae bacterium]
MGLEGVHVEVTGDGPQTVVLIHGFSDNANTWRRVVPALATRYRVVALDLPGHGRSTRVWTTPLVDGYVDLVAEVLDALGTAGPVSIVGNSMGAVVATMYAERFADQVDRIALIGMPGVHAVPMLWRLAASRPAAIAMRTAFAPIPVSRLQRSFGWIYAHAASPQPGVIDPTALRGYFDTYANRDRLFGLADIARALLAELRVLRLDGVLARETVPTLQIWGRYDRLVPSRHVADRGVPRQPGVVVLPGCGHCPQLDAPDILLATLLPFLAAEPGSDARLPARRAGNVRAGTDTRAPRS